MMSSVTRSGHDMTKLCIVARAPARASRLTTHVKASPLAFSLSSSLLLLGKAFLHSNIHLGRRPLTTLLPRLIMAPMSSHPALVLSSLNLGFWVCPALLMSSSPQLKIIFPLVCGMPLGVTL